MRRLSIIALTVFLSMGAAAAEEKPSPKAKALTAEQAADAIVVAAETKDTAALKKLAEARAPDPWIVASLLCHRDKHDAAAAFATAAPRKATTGLKAYVASRRGKPKDEKARKALEVLNGHVDAKSWRAATAVAVPPSSDAVIAIRLAFGRGLALSALSKSPKVRELFGKIEAAAEKLGWWARIARARSAAGMCAYREGRFDVAAALWTQALKLNEDLGANKSTMIGSLSNTGVAQLRMRAWKQAIETFRRVITWQEELGNKRGVILAFGSIASAQKGLRNVGDAAATYEHQLKLYEALGDKGGMTKTLHALGGTYHVAGQHEKSLATYRRALALGESVGNQRSVASSLTNMGTALLKLGRFDEALVALKRSTKILESVGDTRHLATTLHNMAGVLQKLGRNAESVTHWEHSLRLQTELGDSKIIRATLRSLGGAQYRVGSFPSALATYRRLLATAEASGDKAAIADAHHHVGTLHQLLGAYSKALLSYRRTLAIYESIGEHRLVAMTLGNLGRPQLNIGEHARALELYERALSTYGPDDHHKRAKCMDNMGEVYREMGKHDDALSWHKRALALKESLGDKYQIAMSIANIGSVQGQTGAYADAIVSYRRAIAVFEELGYTHDLAAAWANIGGALASDQKYAEAIKALQKAQEVRGESTSHRFQAASHSGLAAAYLGMREYKKSIASARAAVEAINKFSQGLAEGEGAGARDLHAKAFDRGSRAAVMADSADDLLWFLEQGRAGSLREALGSREALEVAVIPEGLRAALATARDRSRQLLGELRTAQKRRNFKAVRKAKRNWDEAEAAVSRAARRIQLEAKAAAQVTLSDPDTREAICKRLAPDEVIVIYGLTAKAVLTVTLSKDGARARAQPVAERLGSLLEELALDDVDTDSTKTVAALRKLLAAPLELGKGVKRVLVSPTGQLGYVPFSLLFPNREVVYVPSATTHGLLLAQAAASAPRAGTARVQDILALGDPDYGTIAKSTERVHRGASGLKLMRLPASRAEIQAIGTTRLLGAKASESGLQAAISDAKRWRAVHFACHGLVDPEHPMRSSLALTADTENDGFLTALEIFPMKIPADLVVMSACETAMGRIYKTEGILGLTRAFMFAGAPRVICSLWKVDDAATQALMIKFYELWNPKGAAKGLSAAAALKQAQEHIKAQTQWKHPYYWAAWVLWGLP